MIRNHRNALRAGLLLALLPVSWGGLSAADTVEAGPSIKGEVKKTSTLPGGRWRVHDLDRPKPALVVPAREAGKPPSDAIVLFDGHGLSAFTGQDGNPSDWTVRDGVLTVPPRSSYRAAKSIQTRDSFGDIQLHIEFRTPAHVVGSGQMRGNSGVILMGLYEVQILDSHENPTYADGQASAIYGWRPPLVNAARKPGEWQSYDIVFTRPRFSPDGKLARPAFVTVLHNGVCTQANQEILGRTASLTPATYEAHADALPLVLQDHASAVSFRNIWIRRLEMPGGKDGN